MSDVTAQVDKIIAEHLGVDPEKVTPDASLIDDLHGDSLDIVELAMTFENELRIQISDDEADSLHLVSDCHQLCEAKVGAQQAA